MDVNNEKKAIIELQGICKSFSVGKRTAKVLKGIDLSINNGEMTAIMAASGCGKSTLLSILAGIDKETHGSFTFQSNHPVIGYMLQTDSLFPWLTIYENAILGLKIQKKDTKENKEYVRHLLKTYKLDEFETKYPHELSGGMKQRVLRI